MRVSCVHPFGSLRPVAAVLVLAALAPGAASAARIRPKALTARDFVAARAPLGRFLNAGPAVWARTTPMVSGRVRTLALAGGQAPSGALLDYLTWRRDLNPTRFDRFHPYLGNLIASATPTALPVPTPPSPQVVPPSIPPLVPPRPQTTVPEPSTWMIGLGLIAAAGVARKRRGVRDLLH